MTDPDDIGPGYVPPPGTPLVTQADRWSWQRKAVRALGDILDSHPDLPQIVWTIGPTGGLTGQVNGLAPAKEVRATFSAWQHALRLEGVREAPIMDTGVTALSGQAYHGTVQVGLIARVFGPLPDDETPTETLQPEVAPGPSNPTHRSRENRPPTARQRSTPATQMGGLPAGLRIPPPSPDGPQPTQHPRGVT